MARGNFVAQWRAGPVLWNSHNVASTFNGLANQWKYRLSPPFYLASALSPFRLFEATPSCSSQASMMGVTASHLAPFILAPFCILV